MIDANQRWDVGEAIARVRELFERVLATNDLNRDGFIDIVVGHVEA